MSKAWTFEKATVHARSPVTVTLNIRSSAFDKPFKWSVTVVDSTGARLFHVDHDDIDSDKFFGEEGFISGCDSYQKCKEKWYFEDLPKEVGQAVEIVDQTNQPAEAFQRDVLVNLANEFLTGRKVSDERRASTIDEMLLLLESRFDRLYVPSDPHTEDTTFMYVPSLDSFVPYWQP